MPAGARQESFVLVAAFSFSTIVAFGSLAADLRARVFAATGGPALPHQELAISGNDCGLLVISVRLDCGRGSLVLSAHGNALILRC